MRPSDQLDDEGLEPTASPGPSLAAAIHCGGIPGPLLLHALAKSYRFFASLRLMLRSQRFLVVGPVVVFLAVLAAEAAAAGLGLWPSSEALWYLNLEVFGFLQQSHYFIADQLSIPYGRLVLVAAPILAVAVIGQLTRVRLLMAILSNLSFVFAGFAVYCNWFAGNVDVRAASLDLSVVATQPGSYVILAVTLATAVSFTISHVMYLRHVR